MMFPECIMCMEICHNSPMKERNQGAVLSEKMFIMCGRTSGYNEH